MAYFSVRQTLRARHVLASSTTHACWRWPSCTSAASRGSTISAPGGPTASARSPRAPSAITAISIRGFKLFLYLTDVDETSGPHVFMKDSHASPLLDTGKAQSDEAVRAAFGAGNEIHMVGPAGTWFLADTFGYHKGALPVTGRRLMLVPQYNLNRTPHLPPAGPPHDVVRRARRLNLFHDLASLQPAGSRLLTRSHGPSSPRYRSRFARPGKFLRCCAPAGHASARDTCRSGARFRRSTRDAGSRRACGRPLRGRAMPRSLAIFMLQARPLLVWTSSVWAAS